MAWHGMACTYYLQWLAVAGAFSKYEYIMHSSSKQPWLALFCTSWPAG